MYRTTTPMRFRQLIIGIALVALAGCGGAESRKVRHMEKGRTFLAAGNYEKARVEFRNALQIAPVDSEVRYENGVVAEKMGYPRQAAQFYEGAIETNSDHVPARIGLGRMYLFGGAPDKALETIKPTLEKHPDDAGLLTVRAAVKVQMKDLDGALEDAERAAMLAPDTEDTVSVLAGVYNSTNQSAKAETLLLQTIKRIPQTVNLRLVLAQLYASSNRQSELEATLLELVRLQPQDTAHRLRLAQFYARNNHPDEAERVLREGIKTLPEQRNLKLGLVDFLVVRHGPEAAEKELAAFIARDPSDYELKFALGQLYEQGKKYSKAEAIYQAAIDSAGLDAPGITARNRLAALRIQQNDSTAAEKLIAEVLAKNPRDNEALIMRGNLALAHKDPKAAIASLRAVLRDQPNAIGVMRSLARAHLANGEPALAEETMRRAVDANTGDAGARLDLAQLLLQLGKPSQAAPVINELVTRQPNNVQALDAQFKIAAALRDRVMGKASADALVALQPKAALGYYYEGVIAEADKRPDEALHQYSLALDQQQDSAEPLQAWTRLLVASKRAPEALAHLEGLITRYPNSALAANLKGEVLLSTQHAAEAAQAFKLAIQRAPKWAIPYRNLAAAESVDDDAPAVIATLKQGIGAASDPGPLEAELASDYEHGGRVDEAIRVYEASLARNPRSDVAANNLAMLLVTYKTDHASIGRAKELSARFAASMNGDFLDTYGWVLYKSGDGTGAIAALQTALAKIPDSPSSLYHLGMAQALAGQADAARETLARSLKSGKTFTGMEEAKATLDKLAKLATGSSAPPKS